MRYETKCLLMIALGRLMQIGGFILIAIVLLSGCSNVPQVDMGDTPYKVHYFDGLEDFNEARVAFGRAPTESAKGTYAWSEGKCNILIRRVSEAWDACTREHEKRHCAEGKWHKGKNDSCW